MYPNNDPWAQQQQPQGGPQPPGGWGPPPGYPPQQQNWGQPQAAPQAIPPRQVTEEPPDPDELLGGSYRAAQFTNTGTVIGGRIVAKPKTTQQRDFQTKALKFYPDSGRPAWQIVVPVQVSEPTEDDDGVRAFYLKGQMRQAVTAAVRQAGAERLEVGGVLQIRYVRDEPSRTGGMPQKIYEARYQPPAGNPPAPTSPAPAVMAQLPAAQQQNLQSQFDSSPPF
jgi:hypothetical protein